jgi:hypothetical protein
MKLTEKILSDLGFSEWYRDRSLLLHFGGRKYIFAKRLSKEQWGLIALNNFPSNDELDCVEKWSWAYVNTLMEVFDFLKRDYILLGMEKEKARMKELLGLS